MKSPGLSGVARSLEKSAVFLSWVSAIAERRLKLQNPRQPSQVLAWWELEN